MSLSEWRQNAPPTTKRPTNEAPIPFAKQKVEQPNIFFTKSFGYWRSPPGSFPTPRTGVTRWRTRQASKTIRVAHAEQSGIDALQLKVPGGKRA